MGRFLKLFNTTAEYNAYTADTANFVLPNVSLCKDNDSVHYTPVISMANAVITCDSATYNGQTQIATNIVVTLNGSTLVSGTDYTVSNNDGGVNAGNYTFTIDGIGNYDGSKNGTFTIGKVTPTVTAPTAISSLVYNADAQALVNAGSTDYGTLQYSLDNSNYSTTIPSGTNAVSYTIYYKVVGDSNVNDVAAASINNPISKVTPTVVIPVAKVLTYQKGVAQELVTAGSTNYGTMKYSTDGETYSTSVPSKIKADSYTVYYFVEGDSNVNSTDVATVACSINEKPVTATIELSQNTYTYDGSAKEPTVTVKDGGDVIDPSEYTVTYSNNTNAGTASVTITDNTAGDYNVSGVTTFTINKANPTYTAPTATSPTYNGSAQNLLNAGSTSDGIIQYSSDNSTWNTTIPTGINANTYTSYWRLVGDSNHNDVASTSISTTIAKASQSAPTATGASVLEGSTATATASGGGGQGSIEWSNGNTRTAVGSQNTQARWTGNGNYNASSWSSSVTLTVRPAHAGHEYVDLGLPSGTKWATMNIGANSITDYGNYYQYGKGSAQYAATSGQSDYSGTENPLAESADTATQVWGGQWHMPTKAQFEELTANTTYTWTTIDGIKGGKFTAQNGNYVFFPADGHWSDGRVSNVGIYGYYWSSTPSSSGIAYGLNFYGSYGGGKVVDIYRSNFGYSVRGVVG